MENFPDKTVVRSWARLMKFQQMALAVTETTLRSAGFPPLAWYDALLELERVGEAGMRPFELEAKMLLAQHNLSRLIDRLEAARYVERRACLDDRRGQKLVITTAGKQIRLEMWPTYANVIQNVVGNQISFESAKNLDEILGKLIEKFVES